VCVCLCVFCVHDMHACVCLCVCVCVRVGIRVHAHACKDAIQNPQMHGKGRTKGGKNQGRLVRRFRVHEERNAHVCMKNETHTTVITREAIDSAADLKKRGVLAWVQQHRRGRAVRIGLRK
jgi:hypothetical protein